MSTAIIRYSDARTLMIDWIEARLPSFGYTGMSVTSRVPKPRPDRFVLVFRTGGVEQTVVSEQAQLTIECWASTDTEAHDLAQVVRGIVRAAGGELLGTVQCYSVTEASTPQDLPDPSSDHQFRWTWTVLAHLRGTQLQPT
jgi:hypothetical protein